jgi:DNA polymerase I
MIQKRLSKDVSDYENHTLQFIAARQLTKQGLRVNPGETITFLIVDEKNPIPEKRVLANEFVTEDSNYDLIKYETMLIRAASTILSPLGYDSDRLQRSLKFQNHKILEYTS